MLTKCWLLIFELLDKKCKQKITEKMKKIRLFSLCLSAFYVRWTLKRSISLVFWYFPLHITIVFSRFLQNGDACEALIWAREKILSCGVSYCSRFLSFCTLLSEAVNKMHCSLFCGRGKCCLHDKVEWWHAGLALMCIYHTEG